MVGWRVARLVGVVVCTLAGLPMRATCHLTEQRDPVGRETQGAFRCRFTAYRPKIVAVFRLGNHNHFSAKKMEQLDGTHISRNHDKMNASSFVSNAMPMTLSSARSGARRAARRRAFVASREKFNVARTARHKYTHAHAAPKTEVQCRGRAIRTRTGSQRARTRLTRSGASAKAVKFVPRPAHRPAPRPASRGVLPRRR